MTSSFPFLSCLAVVAGLTACSTIPKPGDYATMDIRPDAWDDANHVAAFTNASPHAADIYLNGPTGYRLLKAGLEPHGRHNAIHEWCDNEPRQYVAIQRTEVEAVKTNEFWFPKTPRMIDKPGQVKIFTIK